MVIMVGLLVMARCTKGKSKDGKENENKSGLHNENTRNVMCVCVKRLERVRVREYESSSLE